MNWVKFKSRKGKVLIAGVLITSLGIISRPATAQINDTVSLLSNSIYGATGVDIKPYLEYIQFVTESYKSVATTNLSKILEGIVVNSGALGIPLPKEVQTAINKTTNQADTEVGAFGIEPALLNQVLQGQVDYEIAKSGAEALLSEEGQQKIIDLKQMTAKVAAASVQASQTAQQENVTQDVLKQIAVQNKGNTAILKSIYDSTVDSQVANAQTAQAIGNISKTLSEEAWSKRVDNQAGQIGLMDTTAQFSALVSPQKNN